MGATGAHRNQKHERNKSGDIAFTVVLRTSRLLRSRTGSGISAIRAARSRFPVHSFLASLEVQEADEPQANSLGDAIQSGVEFLVGCRMGFGMQAEVGGHSGDYGCKADRERQALKRRFRLTCRASSRWSVSSCSSSSPTPKDQPTMPCGISTAWGGDPLRKDLRPKSAEQGSSRLKIPKPN